MRVIRSLTAMHRQVQRWRVQGHRVGFVPTMGALHAGHVALCTRARRETDKVVASIFVNPLQFGPAEDFRRYPRPWVRDQQVARTAGVDVIFRPTTAAMYPRGMSTTVEVAGLSQGLCGRFRPGHFHGVATVVAALLHIVDPDDLYLGQKDAQQARMLTQLVGDLHLPVRVCIVPTVRETDGLAVSSRNAYLSPAQRRAAPALHRALTQGVQRIRHGEHRAAAVARVIRRVLEQAPGMRVQYVAVVDAKTLILQRRLHGRVLVAAAVWLGRTRLIDNLVVKV